MAPDVTLSGAERQALDALLPTDQQTGNLRDDLIAAARVAWARRQENTRLGGAVLDALHRETNSWRDVQALTAIPHSTARRWATPPEQADGES
jgi:hypothetical protein